MKLNRSSRRPLLIVSLVMGLSALVAGVTRAQEAPVGLGTTESFAVLAGAGVTNTGPSIIRGSLGTCPTPAITGFPPGTVLDGTIHAADAVCLQAQSDLTIAYNDAAGRAPTTTYPGVQDLGGLTLAPGVYKATAFAITGTLTLDAQGDPNAVWIFQSESTLITEPNSRVVLINGAQPCNVFWQVGSSATLGVGSTFVGTILALTSITANTNATVQGRLLARNGAVTLDSNQVTRPVCAPTPTTTSSTTSSSITTTSTTTPATTTSSTTVSPTTTSSTTVPTTTIPPVTVPPITVPPVTLPPTTLPDIPLPTTTLPDIPLPTTTLPDIPLPTTTLPDITVPPITLPDITVPPITLPDIGLPTTTTSSTTTTLLATTTTAAGQQTTTTTIPGSGGVGTGATTTSSSSTTTMPTATTTTSSTTSTTVGPTTGAASTTTTPSGSSTADESGLTTVTTAAGAGVADRATTGPLARTGSSVRWVQFWAGVALAVGGGMVLVAREEITVRRRTGSETH